MSERENILGRIREALRVPAPFPGHHSPGEPSHTPTPRAAATGARNWLPAVGPAFEDHVRAFQVCAADLKADFQLLDSPASLPPAVAVLRQAEGWKKAAVHSGSLSNIAAEALGLPLVRVDSGYDVNDLESCDVGVTECDALIAQTGSVLITSRSAGGRALSVLPPHHLVVARRDQLLPDLPAAFELLSRKYAGNFPSFMGFVTGPSRTGDIERILVLGAHGPKKLTIICC
jgi:L-lactate dehydrogenase complex protein LldG